MVFLMEEDIFLQLIYVAVFIGQFSMHKNHYYILYSIYLLTLVLISVLYCTSFILLFLGIILNIIRFFCKKNREESFSILLIRCIINIVLTVPSLFIFIVNNDVLWMLPCLFINLLLTVVLVITGYKF